jgi:hypothetical protein
VEALEERNLLSFLPAVNYPAGTAPDYVAVGDFNADGVPDLAVADYGVDNSFSATVTVLLGNGDGTYRASAVIPNLAGPRSLALADLNGDGKLDIAEVGYFTNASGASSSSISIFLGNGDGTFQPRRFVSSSPALSSIVVADFNGDGVPDLAVTNDDSLFGAASGVTVFLGNGDATFRPLVTYYLRPSTHNFATLADLNGDGIPDLAMANAGSNSVAVLLGHGDGSFGLPAYYDAGGTPALVGAVGDVNGDGFPDLATVNTVQGTVSLLLSTGPGTFGAPRIFHVGPQPTDLVTGDFNGDGVTDAAISFSQGVRVFLGHPDGSFSHYGDFPTGTSPSWLVAIDANHDGLLDLVVANSGSNNLSVLLNDGNWSTSPAGSSGSALPGDAQSADGSPSIPAPAPARTTAAMLEQGPIQAVADGAAPAAGGEQFLNALANSWPSGLTLEGLDLWPGW